jgi:hypothetical protein
MPEDVLFQVVLPEGSKDPSAVVPFPVEQRLEVQIPAQLKILLLKFNKFVGYIVDIFHYYVL